MNFKVEIQAMALADLDAIHESLGLYSVATADRTYELIRQGILGLNDFPRRFAIAPESKRSSVELRQCTVGNYRIIYSIIGQSVLVLRIVHTSRQTFNPIELF